MYKEATMHESTLIRSTVRQIESSTKFKITNRTNYYRDSYYTLLRMKIPFINEMKEIEFKIDTGSPFTVIRLRDIIQLDEENNPITDADKDKKNLIMAKTNSLGTIGSATGMDMDLRYIEVEKFKLSTEIIFPKIEIYLSESLRPCSILGMDILTMFTFMYRHTDKSFNIFYSDDYLEKAEKYMRGYYDGCIRPRYIGLLDERNIELNNKYKFTEQDIEANYINNLINNQDTP